MAVFKCAKNQVVLMHGKVVAKAENGIIETNISEIVEHLRNVLKFEEVGREYREDAPVEVKEPEAVEPAKVRGPGRARARVK